MTNLLSHPFDGTAAAANPHGLAAARLHFSLAKTALAVAAVLLAQLASSQALAQALAQPLKPNTLGGAAPVSALAPNTQLVMSRVVQLAGVETLSAVTSVQPGDVLHYTATFSNPGTSSLRDVVASMPVPIGTQWLPSSAQPAQVQASVDGKHFARMPLLRTQRLPDGRTVDVPVPVAEIRFLRWPATTLAAGERFATSLRVRVGLDAEPVATAQTGPASTRVAGAAGAAGIAPGTQVATR